MKYLALVALILTGCNSGNSLDAQVEKCTQAFVKAAVLDGRASTDAKKAEMEFAARYSCLQAASGKKSD